MKTSNIISKINKSFTKSTNQFPVVGIGASAGGLDAFKKLLKAIPENSGLAYVLVQHLDPKHESLLPELLQKVTNIPVIEITDDIKVVPDHIYIIPSNKMLMANDGVLQLSPRTTNRNERNLPIDLFFKSLAEVHQSHAIGVVLSGTASDGTQGLKAIKEHGGVTFAQDEESAAYEGMPHSAAQAGVVDFILSPEKIPQKIFDITSKIILSDDELQNIPQSDEDVFKQILALLRLRKGTDFTYYKQTTIRRRLLRRMAINKYEEPVNYLKYLRENKKEQDVLYQDFLIPVTGFFRDPKTFDILCNTVFPLIAKNKTAAEPIRMWVAGCSTGEEVYSIAICLKELLGDMSYTIIDQKVQIFATDINEPAIAKARSGIYSKSDVEGLTPKQLKEFFTKNNGGYQANQSIRDMCVFAVHNFLKDPPFGKMDFISCRNVLIYMEPYLQKKALTTFHYALNAKGSLSLGKSETISSVPELFTIASHEEVLFSRNEKLFTRKDAPGRFMHTASHGTEQSFANMNENTKSENIVTDFQKTADNIILSKYTPAGVVVNESMDIVHFRGRTGAYLEPSPGKPNLNLIKMAKNGLGFELRNLLHKAKKDGVPVIKENIPVEMNGSQRIVAIEAIPLLNIVEPHYLVLFHDVVQTTNSQFLPQNAGPKPKISSKSKKDEKDLRIQQLEQELAQIHEDMRSISEDQEAVNEELQSANEELLSGSEELQSLNEEMETSKEELQSSNEELAVVNQEMIGLNEEVSAARDYAEAIVTTIREPLLILDKYLRVKSANSSFFKTFQVNERETEGRLVYELGDNEWNIPELRTLLEEILPLKSKFADFKVMRSFENLGERVMLLNAREIITEKTEEKLILLAIEDITEKATARKKIEESITNYNMILMQSPFAFSIMKGRDMVITLANNLMKEFWGKGEQVEGKTLLQVLPELRDQPFPGMIDDVYTTGKPVYANEILARLNHHGKIEDRYFNIVYQPHLEADETISGVITIAHEVTNQVIARRKIEESEERFRNLVESSINPICILKGEDLILVLANEPVFKTWNVGKESLGKPFLEIVPEMKDQLFYGWLLDVLRNGVTHSGNEELAYFIRENGEKQVIYFNFVYHPYRENDGTISGVMFLATDVTEQVVARKKMEAQADMVIGLLMTAPGFVCTLNGPDHVYDLVNERYQQLFGKRKIQGKPMLVALPELEGQGFDKLLDKVYETGETFVGIDIPITLARDENIAPELRYFNFSYQPIYDENKKIYSILVFGYEVTDQVIAKNKNLENQQSHGKELEEKVQQRTYELNEANEELIKKNKELESFSYLSSHDLQEPLRKIQTFSALILEKEYTVLSDKGKDYFNRMKDAAGRMQELLEDLLTYSHTNISERKFENSDLNKIVEEVQNELRETILEKNAIIEVNKLCEVNINPSQFRQVMHNLIGNALKFSIPGTPPQITIKSTIAQGSQFKNEKSALPTGQAGLPSGSLLPKKNYCHISISDNGIGFDPQYKDQIFEVFQRLHGKEEYAGTGIGLAIVKKIVENHNGFITARGDLNKGSTFNIYIPAS